jgi:hypothetical protein
VNVARVEAALAVADINAVVRDLIPPSGWVLQAAVIARAEERGVSAASASAAIASLACGDLEIRNDGRSLWLRWRTT